MGALGALSIASQIEGWPNKNVDVVYKVMSNSTMPDGLTLLLLEDYHALSSIKNTLVDHLEDKFF